MRRTKIVATLGPASEDPAALERLIRAGTDVCRLNLSHGGLDEHLHRMGRVREAADRAGRPVGVLADLPGPKIRSGDFPAGGVAMRPGSAVRLVPGDGPSDASVVTVGYPTLLEDVDPGTRVVLGDGTICNAGGKVVKNVAGYDLGKLVCGSQGSLALIGRVSLRLHPVPPVAATLVVESTATAPLASALLRSQLQPSALDVLHPGRVAVLFEGLPRAVDETGQAPER